jgi:hypothetical protein
MGRNLLLLFVGFVLTTVAGGFLGYWLQGRAWERQELARRLQGELDAARVFFEDLSRLFDRRLHRMRELDLWLTRSAGTEEVERSLMRYREVVDDWNDNVNRILALAQRYFGPTLRDNLDYGLMARFVEAGRQLEARVREYRDDGEPSSPPVATALDSLASDVYDLNLELIEAIQAGLVGVFHPDVRTTGPRGS